MRRRLCLVNQPQRQTVTASTGLPGALYGTKYSDANGDGVRNSVLPGATTLNPIVLQQVALPNVPQAFGYYEPGNRRRACGSRHLLQALRPRRQTRFQRPP